MTYPFRGKKKREILKIRELIRGRLQQIEMEREKLSRNIVVWHHGKKEYLNNIFVVELYFGDNYLSADDVARLLVDRIGDVFDVYG